MAQAFKSLKGHLLLDSGQLTGSFFHRAVVLICQHDTDGAVGLILNKSSESKVGEMVVADLPEVLKEKTLFVGGPVQPSALSFLHTDTFLLDSNIMPDLSLGNSLESLVEIGESYSPAKKVRLFAGYSGWGSGQLESELARKAWLVFPATIDLVFQPNPDHLWRQILHAQPNWQHRLLAEAPEDLSWN